jgi:hypothetical protein
MAKLTRITENTITDVNTGEIVKSEISKEFYLPKEPDFIKLYLNDVAYMSDLPKWVTGILYDLLRRMDYENIISLPSGTKRLIAEKMSINPKTIDNALGQFVKKGILIKKDTGVYLANPTYFGKGSWANIYKIRMTVSYVNGHRMFEGEIEKEETSENQ